MTIKSSVTKKKVALKSQVISARDAEEKAISNLLRNKFKQSKTKSMELEEKTKGDTAFSINKRFEDLIATFEKAISEGKATIVKGENPKDKGIKAYFIVTGKDGDKFMCSDYKERIDDLFVEGGIKTYKQTVKSLRREFNILEDWQLEEVR